MSSTFQEADVYTRYQRIYSRCTNKEVIKTLYETDKLLFSPEFINSIIILGEKSEYNINDFHHLTVILICPFFATYMKITDNSLLQYQHEVLDEYFKAICEDLNKQHRAIKNRILTLLRLKLTIPTIQSSLSFNNPTVSISSTYRPKEQELATAGCDIKNILKHTFYKAVKDSNSQSYTHNSYPSSIQLQGPILNKLATYTLILQQEIMRQSNACGVKTKTFVRNTHNMSLGIGDNGGMMDDGFESSSGIFVPSLNGNNY